MSIVFHSENISISTKLIEDARNIVVTAHKSPDGDAVGSVLAMSQLLKALGKQHEVILPDASPGYLSWLQGFDDILYFDTETTRCSEAIQSADLIFVLDYNTLSRVGSEMEKALRSASASFIMIDHHQQPEALKGAVFSDTSICSTCQMVYEFTVASGWKSHISTAMAEAVYCGIMTDSGSFRFPSVTPETHRIVADLMDNGLDHARVHREVYDTNLLDRLRLIGFALSERLEVLEECATAIIYLSKADMEPFHPRPGDTEGLVNQALSIQGVKLAAFFREGNNEVKVSFRSKGQFDVNTFARANWRGGGHRNAAGGSASETLNEAVVRFKTEINSIAKEIRES